MKEIYNRISELLLILAIISAILFTYPAIALSDIVWNDGGVHVIDYIIPAPIHVHVYDNVEFPYNPTSLNLVNGGSVHYVDVYDNSFITTTGGHADQLRAWDFASITMNNGEADRILLFGSSTGTILDGYVDQQFYGGAGSDSIGCIQGGTIALVQFYSTAIISGGGIGEIRGKGDSEISMSGGDVDVIRPTDNTSITLYGYSFDAPFRTYTRYDNLTILDGIFADGTNISAVVSIEDNATLTLSFVPAPEPVDIDIMPRTCPNEFHIKGGGFVEVAILGTVDFDVNDIDIASVRLEAVAPTRSSLKDKSSPVVPPPTACECTTEGRDGFIDLRLKFDKKEVLNALGEVNVGDELVLTLTGSLNDETPIGGQDCILIVEKGKKD